MARILRGTPHSTLITITTLFLSIQQITKGVLAETYSVDSQESSLELKPLIPLTEKLVTLKKNFETLITAFDKKPKSGDEFIENSSNSISVDLSEVIKFEKTVSGIKKLSLLTAFEGIALHSLKETLCKFNKKFNQTESSLKVKILPGEFESFTKLLNELNNDLASIAKETLDEQLLGSCVDKIKFHNFHEAWNTLGRTTKKAKIYYVVKEVYDRNTHNFDRLLHFAKSAPDGHQSIEVYDALYHEIMHVRHDQTSRLLYFIDHLGNEIITKSQKFTTSEKNQYEGFLCILHKSLLQKVSTASEQDLKHISFGEKLQKILINERKIFGANSRCKSELEVVKKKLSFTIEAMIFEHPVFLRNLPYQELLCVSNETSTHGNVSNYRQVFTRKWEPIPRRNMECKWKLKRFRGGNYAIINLQHDEVLFSDVQKFPRTFNAADGSVNGRDYSTYVDYDGTDESYAKDENKRYVCTSPKLHTNTIDSFWHFEVIENETLSIKNIHYDECLFADHSKTYRNGERCVFTSTTLDADGYCQKWEVINCS